MKTIMPKQLKNEDRKWYLVDATWLTLWRLSTKIANLVSGKTKVTFSPHLDNWDYVVVINADKISVTGKKLSDKIYYSHTGYLGGLKEISLEKLLVKKPTEALRKSVNGMLPKNKLRKWMMARLKLVQGAEHTFGAQQPQKIDL